MLASIAEQLKEAEALAARGEKPYVPEFLFTSGVFKSREEYDRLTENPVYVVQAGTPRQPAVKKK